MESSTFVTSGAGAQGLTDPVGANLALGRPQRQAGQGRLSVLPLGCSPGDRGQGPALAWGGEVRAGGWSELRVKGPWSGTCPLSQGV